MTERQNDEPDVILSELPNDLKKFAFDLFDSFPATDPRSQRYQRKIIRPKINWWKDILFVLGLSFVSWLLTIVLVNINSRLLPVGFLLCLLVWAMAAKWMVIELIRIYQHYAPISLRNRCCFEPSCSVYTILALKKYGTIRGCVKGWKHFRRCNPQQGGFEDP